MLQNDEAIGNEVCWNKRKQLGQGLPGLREVSVKQWNKNRPPRWGHSFNLNPKFFTAFFNKLVFGFSIVFNITVKARRMYFLSHNKKIKNICYIKKDRGVHLICIWFVSIWFENLSDLQSIQLLYNKKTILLCEGVMSKFFKN